MTTSYSSCVCRYAVCLQLCCHGEFNSMHARTVFWMCSALAPSHMSRPTVRLRKAAPQADGPCDGCTTGVCGQTGRLEEATWNCSKLRPQKRCEHFDVCVTFSNRITSQHSVESALRMHILDRRVLTPDQKRMWGFCNVSLCAFVKHNHAINCNIM